MLREAFKTRQSGAIKTKMQTISINVRYLTIISNFIADVGTVSITWIELKLRSNRNIVREN